MRELIRPTLFTIARLALFFAIVAWLFGQWFYVIVEMNFDGSKLHVSTGLDGVKVRTWPVGDEWQFTVGRLGKNAWGFFKDFESQLARRAFGWTEGIVPGQITVLDYSDEPVGFIAHYYLIITIFPCPMVR